MISIRSSNQKIISPGSPLFWRKRPNSQRIVHTTHSAILLFFEYQDKLSVRLDLPKLWIYRYLKILSEPKWPIAKWTEILWSSISDETLPNLSMKTLQCVVYFDHSMNTRITLPWFECGSILRGYWFIDIWKSKAIRNYQ